MFTGKECSKFVQLHKICSELHNQRGLRNIIISCGLHDSHCFISHISCHDSFSTNPTAKAAINRGVFSRPRRPSKIPTSLTSAPHPLSGVVCKNFGNNGKTQALLTSSSLVKVWLPLPFVKDARGRVITPLLSFNPQPNLCRHMPTLLANYC